MSTAEVQIKIGTTADLSGIKQTKDGIAGLQGELQKKLSARGIGMSLLEGLGIGSGFRLADTIAEAIVKPFKEAADYAQALERNTQNALDRFRALRDLRNANDAEAQRKALQDDLRRAESAKRAAEQSRKNGVNSGEYTETKNEFGEMRWHMRYIPTAEERAEIIATQEAFDKAANAMAMFDEKQKQLGQNRQKNAAKTSTDKAGDRLDFQNKVIGESIGNAQDWEQKQLDVAKAARDSIDPMAQLNEKIRDYRTAMDAGALSAEDGEKAISKLRAEFAQPREIQESAQMLSEFEAALTKISNDPLLTDAEKRNARRKMLEAENVELARQIKLLQQQQILNPSLDPLGTQARIDALNAKKDANGGELAPRASKLDQSNMGARNLGDSSQHYQSAGDGAQGGLIEALTEFGTMADQIADTIKNTIGGAVQSVGTHMTGWIMRTESFGKALRNIGTSVLSAFINQIIQMGVQWLITQGLIKMGLITTHATGEALKAASTASTISQETMKTPVLATNAGLASVSSFGVAAILGIALLIAGIAALAFESGGMIPGGEKLIRVNEAGQESVLNARATSTLGSAFVNAVNSGDFAAAHQMMSPLGGITRPGFSPEMQEGGEGRAEAAQAGAMNIAVRGFNAQHEIAQWMDSREGRKMIVNLIDGRVSHHS